MRYSRIKLCPVIGGKLYSDEATFCLAVSDGWHQVDVLGRQYIRPAQMQELLTYKSPIRAYFLRGQFVPKSFDVAKRFEVSLKEYNLGNGSTGSPQTFQDFDVLAFCKIRGQVFFVRKEAPDGILFMPKLRLQNGDKLEQVKGATPEQIYLLGCYAMILAEQRLKLEAGSLPNRMKKVLSIAGAKLIEFKVAAKGLIDVTWEYLSHTFLSTVHEKDLRILDNAAGVCLAGSDNRQTLASLPSVVKQAIDGRKLVITRHVDEDDE